MGSHEFLTIMIEFIKVVRDKEKFHIQPTFSKYHREHFLKNLDKSVKPEFPKFIHYSGHAETLEFIF
jgi:hypothetical protein